MAKLIIKSQQFICNYFADWSPWEKLWLLFSTILIVALTLYTKENPIGTIAALTGIVSVVLAAKAKISNYYFGLINVIAYGIVAWQCRYYGLMMLHLLYFLPMQCYGIYIWFRNKKLDAIDEVYVKYLSTRQRLIYIIFWIILSIGYGFVLKAMGGKLPFVDSTNTILSIIAMLLMSRLYVEQWAFWLISDVISIFMWLAVILQGGKEIAMLIMWCAYLLNTVYGFGNWIKLYQTQEIRA